MKKTCVITILALAMQAKVALAAAEWPASLLTAQEMLNSDATAGAMRTLITSQSETDTTLGHASHQILQKVDQIGHVWTESEKVGMNIVTKRAYFMYLKDQLEAAPRVLNSNNGSLLQHQIFLANMRFDAMLTQVQAGISLSVMPGSSINSVFDITADDTEKVKQALQAMFANNTEGPQRALLKETFDFEGALRAAEYLATRVTAGPYALAEDLSLENITAISTKERLSEKLQLLIAFYNAIKSSKAGERQFFVHVAKNISPVLLHTSSQLILYLDYIKGEIEVGGTQGAGLGASVGGLDFDDIASMAHHNAATWMAQMGEPVNLGEVALYAFGAVPDGVSESQKAIMALVANQRLAYILMRYHRDELVKGLLIYKTMVDILAEIGLVQGGEMASAELGGGSDLGDDSEDIGSEEG